MSFRRNTQKVSNHGCISLLDLRNERKCFDWVEYTDRLLNHTFKREAYTMNHEVKRINLRHEFSLKFIWITVEIMFNNMYTLFNISEFFFWIQLLWEDIRCANAAVGQSNDQQYMRFATYLIENSILHLNKLNVHQILY